MHVFEDLVIVNVSGEYMVSLSLKDGKRRWVRERLRARTEALPWA